ncbi:MAG: SDR family NAD(P)-dependent oxidoreductase [Candidatus Dormibacteria bacterium]
MNRLESRVALVTGSSRGIGAAIARRFAMEGARVAVHGRDAAAIASVVDGIRRIGAEATGVAADITDARQLELMREQIDTQLGPVEILVANAGASLVPPGPVEQIDPDAWRRSLDLNLTATFLTIRCFLPGMKERGRGDIITISSHAGSRPHERSPVPYAVAKAGVQLLTQDVALQAGPHGVRANCIAPETILTERNASQIPPEVQARLAEAHALRRLGTSDDVAHAAVFLASPEESGWITGVVLPVHGGTTIG